MSETKRFCLQCDDGTVLEYGKRDLTFAYRGRALTVPAISGWHCPKCHDCEFDDGEGQRYSDAQEAFARESDSQFAEEMRAIRKKLGLNQAEAGRLFGGGASAFSEYERGKTQPHKSTVQLLRLLDKHPELLSELTAE